MTERRHTIWVLLGAAIAALWVVIHVDTPFVEDSLFWWVPKGIKAGESGFPMSPAGDLPMAMTINGIEATLLPQWSGGLPDYAHPPLWYWWMGLWTLISPSFLTIKLATLIPAMAAGAGFVALGRRIGSTTAGFAVFALPPFMAQLLRPELDLPLLAFTPWILIALLNRSWGRFAVLSALAVGCKEPAVLFTVPAMIVAFEERRWRVAALTPLIVLLLWGWIHGWMAKPERLPDGFWGWIQDITSVLVIVFIIQGRFLLLIGWNQFRRHQALAGFVAIWLLFFSVVGFFVNRGTADLYTHVRYLLPGMAVAVVVMASRLPILASIGLFWLHVASPYGPEASVFGLDQARAEKKAADGIEALITKGEIVWIGTHQAAGLYQPFAGVVDQPLSGFRTYGMETPSHAVKNGHIVVETTYGEPAGALLTGRQKTLLKQWTVHDASVTAWRIDEANRTP
jgi:hypothetical protein